MRRRRSRLRPHGVSAEVALDLGDPIDVEAFDAELEAAPETARAPETGLSRPRRRWAVGVAGALVLLLGGMAAVDVVSERRLAARLADAPGGIRPLDEAPGELWSVPMSDYSYSALPGLLVTAQDKRLVAYDVEDGTEQWRTEEVGRVVCGGPSWRDLPGTRPGVEDRLVCLEIDPPESGPHLPWDDVTPKRVIVVATDGTVMSGRDLTEADGRVALGPAGTIVRTERVGDAPAPPEDVQVDPATGEVTGLLGPLEGRDLLVTLEEPLTGESLWTDTLPFRAADEPSWCIHWDDDGEDHVLDVDRVSANRQASLLEVWGCGVSATYDVNGTRLDDPSAPHDQVWGMIGDDAVRLGWTADGPGGSEVVGADGALRWAAQGEILVPQVQDRQGETVFPVREHGRGLGAFDHDGDELWTATDFPSVDMVLAHVDDLIVYAASRWTVALDAETGEQRWVSESSLSGVQTTQGFTDGRSIVVVGTDWGSRTIVRALDLHDGEELWSTDLAAGWGDVRVVEGRLFRVSDAEVTRIG